MATKPNPMVSRWPRDTMAEKIAFYGNPSDPRDHSRENPEWRASVEVRLTPPFQMYYAGKPIRTIAVHRKCAEALLAVFDDIWEACGQDQLEVDKSGASDYAGIFNYRVIAGSHNLSNHSFGCAIDLSPKTNGFNMKGTISKIVVDAFDRQGWRWGGRYKGRKDPMHFEAVSPA